MPSRARAHSSSIHGTQAAFATTHWSVVLAAGESSAPGAAEALEKLCQTYWYPLYADLRRRGHSSHDAQDLTQQFLGCLTEKKFFRRADPHRGKFRSFLLGSLKLFLSDERKKEHAQKRGGGQALASLDWQDGESRYAIEPATGLDLDRSFDRGWAMTVLKRTVSRLKEEYDDAGKAGHFAELQHFQPGQGGSSSYAEAAARLGLTESAVKSAIHRLRVRHRQLLREEVAQTVLDPRDVDEEIRYLISVVSV